MSRFTKLFAANAIAAAGIGAAAIALSPSATADPIIPPVPNVPGLAMIQQLASNPAGVGAVAFTGPGREILGDVQGVGAGFLAEETRLGQQGRQGRPRSRDGDVRRQRGGGDFSGSKQAAAGGVELRGLGLERHAQGTVGGDLERVPALQARFDGHEERALFAGDERGARQGGEGFPDEDRTRLEGGPGADRERGDADADVEGQRELPGLRQAEIHRDHAAVVEGLQQGQRLVGVAGQHDPVEAVPVTRGVAHFHAGNSVMRLVYPNNFVLGGQHYPCFIETPLKCTG